MQMLAICRRKTETFTAAQFDALLDEEAEAARRLYAEGVVRSGWSREDVPGAVFLMEADSLEAGTRAIEALPLASRGMLEVTVIPLRGYRGFGPRG